MTSPSGLHLTEEQLTEIVVDGFASGPCREHLASCVPCRERVESEMLAFGASVDAFNRVSLAWSTAQPRRVRTTNSASHHPRRLTFATTALAIAAVTVAIVVPGFYREFHPPVHTHDLAATAEDTPAQIADDNALMVSVNVVLASSDPLPLNQYKLDPYKLDQAPLAVSPETSPKTRTTLRSR